MSMPIPDSCPICSGEILLNRFQCKDCDCRFEGEFIFPRLSRLNRAEQRFIETFILLSGSMKAVADEMRVSYPTIRNKLDQVIESLERRIEEDEKAKDDLLSLVEEGKISADLAAELIDQL